MLYSSTGILHYDLDNNNYYKLILLVDKEIASYYRSMVPQYKKINSTRYAPHISVVRKEVPVNLAAWGKYEGQEINFIYDSEIKFGEVYWWLNCFSKNLEKIRIELGLPVSSLYTLPPDGYEKCFHMTIGNTK